MTTKEMSEKVLSLMEAGDEDGLIEIAQDRVDNTPELKKYEDIIMSDWAEGAEHWAWVCTTTVDEIVEWASEMIETDLFRDGAACLDILLGESND